MKNNGAKLIGAAVAAIFAIAATPTVVRKIQERNWPASAKATEYRHAFASEQRSSAVNTVWATDRPDDQLHGDCSGSYMFITQNDDNLGQKPNYTVEVAVIIDGQPDSTEEGRGADKNFVYIGQLSGSTLTQEARELANFAIKDRFESQSVVLDKTVIIPLQYGEVAKVKGNPAAFAIPSLNLVVMPDPKARPGIGSASIGGMTTGDYTVQSSIVVPAGSAAHSSFVLQR